MKTVTQIPKDSWYAKMGNKETIADPLDNLNSANLLRKSGTIRSVDQIISERRALLNENIRRSAAGEDFQRERTL